MTNEMKLLMSLCEYWGIEVEEDEDFNEDAHNAAMTEYQTSLNSGFMGHHQSGLKCPNPIDFVATDYKLTKKEISPPKEWHRVDILNYKNECLSPAQLFVFERQYDEYKMTYHNRSGNEL